MENLNNFDINILIMLNLVGAYICSQEWGTIWSEGFLKGVGRIVVLNLPIIMAISYIIQK